jgi:RHS repeat-associated protein
LGGSAVEVFFDDFTVEHVKSPVVQQDDYYAFGLTFNSYSRENSTPNDYKYNGKEEQTELGLGWFDYGQRMYDPALGRWWVIDPFTQKMPNWSPYSYAFNNPIRFIDFGGLYPIEIITRSYAPYKTFGPGNSWHGDSRGASVNRNASSRTSVNINHDTETRKTTATGGLTRSHTVDGSKDATSRTEVESNNSKGNKIDVHSAGNNAAQKGSWDIDQFTKLTANIEGNVKDAHVLNISGTVSGDDFPNQESMVFDSKGNGVMLGTFETSGDREMGPVTDLGWENEGDVQMNVGVRISVDKNGVFQGIMVNENGKDKQISVADWNKRFIKEDDKK